MILSDAMSSRGAPRSRLSPCCAITHHRRQSRLGFVIARDAPSAASASARGRCLRLALLNVVWWSLLHAVLGSTAEGAIETGGASVAPFTSSSVPGFATCLLACLLACLPWPDLSTCNAKTNNAWEMRECQP
ncbi:hypothetical protein BU23DRAFT_216329 [Bimuria novae-zelandiae CBS 107.79]|uniref:Uncharacterized protein n=1 Tax=Bimuria novae-zelandiae CBS 107.79 TaxID=1447943 RepID=A0A6A5V0F1_9PLEO|nr:hypothetical protein BU23DRAFT_216329 [Bimuria novae-zelandiae CBS 107.79]